MAKVREVLDERRRQSPCPAGKTAWASSSSGQRSIMPTKRNILIVEDDEDTRELYACCLSLEGFAGQSASDGVEGMARLRAAHPNLVLLDFALPRLTGAGVLRRLRIHPALQLTPLILVSARTQE